jgi:hypothetical protein
LTESQRKACGSWISFAATTTSVGLTLSLSVFSRIPRYLEALSRLPALEELSLEGRFVGKWMFRSRASEPLEKQEDTAPLVFPNLRTLRLLNLHCHMFPDCNCLWRLGAGLTCVEDAVIDDSVLPALAGSNETLQNLELRTNNVVEVVGNPFSSLLPHRCVRLTRLVCSGDYLNPAPGSGMMTRAKTLGYMVREFPRLRELQMPATRLLFEPGPVSSATLSELRVTGTDFLKIGPCPNLEVLVALGSVAGAVSSSETDVPRLRTIRGFRNRAQIQRAFPGATRID